MKKIFLFLMCTVISISVYGNEPKQLEFYGFKENSIEQGNMFLSMMKDSWKLASDGEKDCALVRVNFENIPIIDAEKIKFSTGYGYIQVDNSRLQSRQEIWLWLDPVGDTYIKALTNDNHSDTYTISGTLKPKGVYEITLKSNKTVSLFVETLPTGAIVTLENGQKAVTPEPIHNVSLGTHTLTISFNGRERLKKDINVTETNVKFGPYDLREKKLIKFTSDPSKAEIRLWGEGFNGENIGATPLEKELPYGNYKVQVYLSPTEVDEKNFSVGANTADEIALEPIKKKNFEVYATYAGRKVDASLYIDGKKEGSYQSSYKLVRPIGKKYNMVMSYMGNSKKRTIKVTENMDPMQEFKIAARNSFVWPWQREFDPTIGGLSFGYVTKQWVSAGGGAQFKENIWGDENKSMHGMQMGLYFTPTLQFGLGLYSGLFYELYISSTDNYDWDPYTLFMEHVLYMPVHAYYRLRLANKAHIAVHGGLGMDLALLGSFSDPDHEYEDFTDFYGQEMFPKRFNLSAEIALELRIINFGIKASYSKGITDHKFYDGAKTKQNKMSIGVAYMFSTGD